MLNIGRIIHREVRRCHDGKRTAAVIPCHENSAGRFREFRIITDICCQRPLGVRCSLEHHIFNALGVGIHILTACLELVHIVKSSECQIIQRIYRLLYLFHACVKFEYLILRCKKHLLFGIRLIVL